MSRTVGFWLAVLFVFAGGMLLYFARNTLSQTESGAHRIADPSETVPTGPTLTEFSLTPSASSKVPPTICFTLPSWRSMHGRNFVIAPTLAPVAPDVNPQRKQLRSAPTRSSLGGDSHERLPFRPIRMRPDFRRRM